MYYIYFELIKNKHRRRGWGGRGVTKIAICSQTMANLYHSNDTVFNDIVFNDSFLMSF